MLVLRVASGEHIANRRGGTIVQERRNAPQLAPTIFWRFFPCIEKAY